MGQGVSSTPYRRARLAALFERALGGPPLIPERLRRWVLAVTIIAAACLAGFGFAVRHSSDPVLFDRPVDAFLFQSSGLAYRVAVVLSHFEDAKIFVTITAVVAVALIFLRDYRAAVATLGSVGIAVVLVEHVLKPFFGRHHADLTGATFPSGHATVAFALACAVMIAVRGDRPLGRLLGRALRYLLTAIVLIISSAIGVAMVILQFHYMSDVVAGVPLGLAITGCTAIFLDAVAGRFATMRWLSSPNHSKTM